MATARLPSNQVDKVNGLLGLGGADGAEDEDAQMQDVAGVGAVPVPKAGQEAEELKVVDDSDDDEEAAEEAKDRQAYGAYVPPLPDFLKPAAEHPGQVMETKALSAVRCPPLTYKPSLPHYIFAPAVGSTTSTDESAELRKQDPAYAPYHALLKQRLAEWHDDHGIEAEPPRAEELMDEVQPPERRQARLSGVQIYTVAAAGQAHAKTITLSNNTVVRQGFVVADQTGMGKGRTVAAILVDNWRKGRNRGAWFSVNADLAQDAKRDLKDLCDDISFKSNPTSVKPIPIYDAKKLPRDKRWDSLNKAEMVKACLNPESLDWDASNMRLTEGRQPYPLKGVVFCTYNTLIAGASLDEGVAMAAYPPGLPETDAFMDACKKLSNNAKTGCIFQRLMEWNPQMLMLDEAHKAKNAIQGGEGDDPTDDKDDGSNDVDADDTSKRYKKKAAKRGVKKNFPALAGGGANDDADGAGDDEEQDEDAAVADVVEKLTGTKTGQAVILIQRLLPDARVCYVSATGAYDAKHMVYMERLFLWGAGSAKVVAAGASALDAGAASAGASGRYSLADVSKLASGLPKLSNTKAGADARGISSAAYSYPSSFSYSNPYTAGVAGAYGSGIQYVTKTQVVLECKKVFDPVTRQKTYKQVPVTKSVQVPVPGTGGGGGSGYGGGYGSGYGSGYGAGAGGAAAAAVPAPTADISKAQWPQLDPNAQQFAFPSFNEFLKFMNKYGTGAMELLAMDLKSMGVYVSRSLSLEKVKFDIMEIRTTKEFAASYDAAAVCFKRALNCFGDIKYLFAEINRKPHGAPAPGPSPLWNVSKLDHAKMDVAYLTKLLKDPLRHRGQDGKPLPPWLLSSLQHRPNVSYVSNGRAWQRFMSLFMNANQRFGRQMAMMLKVPEVAKLVVDQLNNGMCAVISLITVFESAINREGAATVAGKGTGKRGRPAGQKAITGFFGKPQAAAASSSSSSAAGVGAGAGRAKSAGAGGAGRGRGRPRKVKDDDYESDFIADSEESASESEEEVDDEDESADDDSDDYKPKSKGRGKGKRASSASAASSARPGKASATGAGGRLRWVGGKASSDSDGDFASAKGSDSESRGGGGRRSRLSSSAPGSDNDDDDDEVEYVPRPTTKRQMAKFEAEAAAAAKGGSSKGAGLSIDASGAKGRRGAGADAAASSSYSSRPPSRMSNDSGSTGLGGSASSPDASSAAASSAQVSPADDAVSPNDALEYGHRLSQQYGSNLFSDDDDDEEEEASISAPADTIYSLCRKHLPLPPIPSALLRKYRLCGLVPAEGIKLERFVVAYGENGKPVVSKSNTKKKKKKNGDDMDDGAGEEEEEEGDDEDGAVYLAAPTDDEPWDEDLTADEKKYCNMYETAAKSIYAILEEVRGLDLRGNPLDNLIAMLGGPHCVAELTGRTYRMVRSDQQHGVDSGYCVDTQLGGFYPTMIAPERTKSGKKPTWVKATRAVGQAKDQVNLAEKDQFQRGEKFIAIISSAASSGISLHAELGRAKNLRKRLHITLDPPWSSDMLMQQTGRTNRSNQASEPHYVFVASDICGDRRFASIVASRMESMGAICNGDRRATGANDLSDFNIVNEAGTKALKRMRALILQHEFEETRRITVKSLELDKMTWLRRALNKSMVKSKRVADAAAAAASAGADGQRNNDGAEAADDGDVDADKEQKQAKDGVAGADAVDASDAMDVDGGAGSGAGASSSSSSSAAPASSGDERKKPKQLLTYLAEAAETRYANFEAVIERARGLYVDMRFLGNPYEATRKVTRPQTSAMLSSAANEKYWWDHEHNEMSSQSDGLHRMLSLVRGGQLENWGAEELLTEKSPFSAPLYYPVYSAWSVKDGNQRFQVTKRCNDAKDTSKDALGGEGGASCGIRRFFNRMFMLPLEDQAVMGALFSVLLDQCIKEMREHGQLDEGIADLSNSSLWGGAPKVVQMPTILARHPHIGPSASTSHAVIEVDRGMHLDKAWALLKANMEHMGVMSEYWRQMVHYEDAAYRAGEAAVAEAETKYKSIAGSRFKGWDMRAGNGGQQKLGFAGAGNKLGGKGQTSRLLAAAGVGRKADADVVAVDVEQEAADDPDAIICHCRKPQSTSNNIIGCEGQSCPHGGWFHMECVGVDPDDVPDGDWYCQQCALVKNSGSLVVPKKPVGFLAPGALDGIGVDTSGASAAAGASGSILQSNAGAAAPAKKKARPVVDDDKDEDAPIEMATLLKQKLEADAAAAVASTGHPEAGSSSSSFSSPPSSSSSASAAATATSEVLDADDSTGNDKSMAASAGGDADDDVKPARRATRAKPAGAIIQAVAAVEASKKRKRGSQDDGVEISEDEIELSGSESESDDDHEMYAAGDKKKKKKPKKAAAADGSSRKLGAAKAKAAIIEIPYAEMQEKRSEARVITISAYKSAHPEPIKPDIPRIDAMTAAVVSGDLKEELAKAGTEMAEKHCGEDGFWPIANGNAPRRNYKILHTVGFWRQSLKGYYTNDLKQELVTTAAEWTSEKLRSRPCFNDNDIILVTAEFEDHDNNKPPILKVWTAEVGMLNLKWVEYFRTWGDRPSDYLRGHGWRKVEDASLIKTMWDDRYKKSATTCMHERARTEGCMPSRVGCPQRWDCDVGQRVLRHSILTGTLVPVLHPLATFVDLEVKLLTDKSHQASLRQQAAASQNLAFGQLDDTASRLSAAAGAGVAAGAGSGRGAGGKGEKDKDEGMKAPKMKVVHFGASELAAHADPAAIKKDAGAGAGAGAASSSSSSSADLEPEPSHIGIALPQRMSKNLLDRLVVYFDRTLAPSQRAANAVSASVADYQQKPDPAAASSLSAGYQQKPDPAAASSSSSWMVKPQPQIKPLPSNAPSVSAATPAAIAAKVDPAKIYTSYSSSSSSVAGAASTAPPVRCANPTCYKTGTRACPSCPTVTYCDAYCQSMHWRTHQLACGKSKAPATTAAATIAAQAKQPPSAAPKPASSFSQVVAASAAGATMTSGGSLGHASLLSSGKFNPPPPGGITGKPISASKRPAASLFSPPASSSAAAKTPATVISSAAAGFGAAKTPATVTSSAAAGFGAAKTPATVTSVAAGFTPATKPAANPRAASVTTKGNGYQVLDDGVIVIDDD